MNARDEATYTLELATRLLTQAERAFQYEDWWFSVRGSRESVENAAKSVIACFSPVEKTHDPDKQLTRLLARKRVDASLERDIEELVLLAKGMGFDKHILIEYGDEKTFTGPSKIFDQKAASEALEVAKKSLAIARKVYEFYSK